MDPKDVQLREVLFQFSREGNAIRVCAIDPDTNTEITMVGARGYNQHILKQLAIRKLKYVIAKNQSQR